MMLYMLGAVSPQHKPVCAQLLPDKQRSVCRVELMVWVLAQDAAAGATDRCRRA